jgi:membrane protein required for beta-lactamase induction
MNGLDKLFIVAWILFGILLTPLFFIALDFIAGKRKAKQRGETITSDKMKRSIDKVARYYNALLAMVVVDAMHIAGIWYLDVYYEYNIPIFPLITLIGAFCVAAVEIKSIYERADEKERNEMKQVAALATELAKQIKNPAGAIEAVNDFLNEDDKEEKK